MFKAAILLISLLSLNAIHASQFSCETEVRFKIKPSLGENKVISLVKKDMDFSNHAVYEVVVVNSQNLSDATPSIPYKAIYKVLVEKVGMSTNACYAIDSALISEVN